MTSCPSGKSSGKPPPACKYPLTFRPIPAIIIGPKPASVAQSVVHLTRNEKVACSSQVTSSTKTRCAATGFRFVIMEKTAPDTKWLPFGYRSGFF